MKLRKIASLALVAVVAAAAGYTVIVTRQGFSSRGTPSLIEKIAATTARGMAIPSEYRQLRNPIAASPENICEAGMEHFSDHCAICHANDGGGDTLFGKGLYPKPPDMRTAETQSKSDGELYYTIENGIRLSGMPAFGQGQDAGTDIETWHLVLFIRHLPQITSQELDEMKGLNPEDGVQTARKNSKNRNF